MIRNALIALCGLALAMPAMAQDTRLGSRLQKRVVAGRELTAEEAARTAHRMAQCLYDRRRSDVMAYLTSLSEEERGRLDRKMLNSIECRDRLIFQSPMIEGISVQTATEVMRGMLAEAALSKLPNDNALQPLPAQPGYARDWFAATGRDPSVDEMAVCVADQNPAAINALLATKPESPEELTALRAIGPSMGPCLRQGATLKANRQGLRAALAEALFHRATAPALATTN